MKTRNTEPCSTHEAFEPETPDAKTFALVNFWCENFKTNSSKTSKQNRRRTPPWVKREFHKRSRGMKGDGLRMILNHRRAVARTGE